MDSSIIILIAICALSLFAAHKMVPADKYKLMYILLAFTALLLRVATVLYIYRGGTDTFGTDGLLYHNEGIRLAQQITDGMPLYALEYKYTWYTALVGMIYHIFGVNRYIVSYINIAFTFFSALFLFKIALNHKYRFANAAFISLIFLYFPNMILWTSDSRKEAILIFLSFLCWYQVQCFIRRIKSGEYSRTGEYIRILFVCALIWLCTIIRIYMFLPLAVGILLSLFLSYRKDRKPITIIFIAAVIIASIIISFATVYPLLDDYHALTFPDGTDDLGEDISNKFATIRSIIAGRNVVKATANYMLLPYPGNIDFPVLRGHDALRLIVSIDMLAWYLCLILMLPGIFGAIRKKEKLFLGLFAFLLSYILINAMVVENVSDTIYRYRSVIIGASLLFIDLDEIGSLVKRFKKILYARHKIKTDAAGTSTASTNATGTSDDGSADGTSNTAISDTTEKD